jgi:hypothetical protein
MRPGELAPEREREREREKSGRGVGNNIFGLKVPRHCPLVLLIGVRLEFRSNSTFFNFKVTGVGGGGAALDRNLVRHLESYIRAKLQCYHWEGCMGSMQCNVEFGYQLSICSGTKENHGKP